MWGYGGAPRVSSSHSSTPNDHCGKGRGDSTLTPNLGGGGPPQVLYLPKPSSWKSIRAHSSVHHKPLPSVSSHHRTLPRVGPREALPVLSARSQ